MSNSENKVVSGGSIWLPNGEMLVNNSVSMDKTRAKRLRQGKLFITCSIILFFLLTVIRLFIISSANEGTYYRLPDTENPIFIGFGFFGSLILGVGLGRALLAASRKQIVVYVSIAVILTFGLNSIPSAIVRGQAASSFNSWLSSEHQLSSFVGETPPTVKIADSPVKMVSTNGDKVTVTFKKTGDKITVDKIVPTVSGENKK